MGPFIGLRPIGLSGAPSRSQEDFMISAVALAHSGLVTVWGSAPASCGRVGRRASAEISRRLGLASRRVAIVPGFAVVTGPCVPSVPFERVCGRTPHARTQPSVGRWTTADSRRAAHRGGRGRIPGRVGRSSHLRRACSGTGTGCTRRRRRTRRGVRRRWHRRSA